MCSEEEDDVDGRADETYPLSEEDVQSLLHQIMERIVLANEEIAMDPSEEEYDDLRDMIEANEGADQIDGVSTFEAGCVLTMNKGITITTKDGSAFQITIVRSR